MDDEKEIKEVEKELVSEVKPVEKVDEPKEEINIIDEAKKINSEMLKTIAEIKKERLALEKITAENLVAGRSYAGKSVEISEEEKAKQDAQKLVEGCYNLW